MQRFDRLEFDDPVPQPPGAPSPRPETDHDEHYWLKRADDEKRDGYFENALRYCSRALEINKAQLAGWLGQVQMLIALGEHPEAELWARKALELFKNSGDLLSARAHALARIGNLHDALPLSDASFGAEGQSAYRWIVRGEIMLARRQDVDQHCFDKAVLVDPDWLVLVDIGRIYRFYRKPARAIIRFGQAVERAADRPLCWYEQGCCEIELGLHKAARRSFEKCLDLKPGHLDAIHRLNDLDAGRWSIRQKINALLRRATHWKT